MMSIFFCLILHADDVSITFWENVGIVVKFGYFKHFLL